MTVSLPLDRAHASPVRAKPLHAARRTALPPSAHPLVADRRAPVPQVACGIVLPKAPVAPKPAAARPASKTTVLLSSALHLALFGGWAVLAAPARPLAPPDLEMAEVVLVSEAQFAALTAPQPQIAEPAGTLPPPVFPDPPAPVLPVAEPPSSPPVAPDLASAAPDPLPETSADLPPPVVPEPPAKKADLPAKKAAAPVAEKPPEKKPKQVEQKQARKAQEKPAKPAPTQKAADKAAAPAKAAAGPSKGEAKALKADWGGKLRARINRKLATPPGSGTVKVRLVVALDGSLLSAGIAQSSGTAALDAAALKAVKSAAPYPRAPKGLAEPSYSFTLPITFKG